MNPSTVLGLVGSLTTLVVLFEMMRRHRLREKYAVFWSVIAIATVVVALFPGILDAAASLIGVAVPSNLLFFVASMLLLLISVQHSHELSRLEDHGRTLAEEVALLRLSVEVLTEEQGRRSPDE
ncbi:MAG: DUF2304 domain-containing protein [Marmoricola sp.]|nr:DUF2304 domain-containing protein [Marmoricola sp.]